MANHHTDAGDKALRDRRAAVYDQAKATLDRGLKTPQDVAAYDRLEAELDAIDFDQLRIAFVSNLVETLKRVGRQHLLVVDRPEAGPERVRGVISRTQIERQLGQTLEVTEVATSFAELGKMLS